MSSTASSLPALAWVSVLGVACLASPAPACDVPVFEYALDVSGVAELVDSPVRRQIASHLLVRKTGVWVLLTTAAIKPPSGLIGCCR